MAKKQEIVSAKIRKDAHRMAKIAAALEGVSIIEYISELVIKQAKKDVARFTGCNLDEEEEP